MCLIALAIDAHSEYSLLIAANRDEYYERPSAPADFWQEAPYVLAGRDLVHGGSWMGISKSGRLAMVTNVRDSGYKKPYPRSRGQLVADFLRGSMDAESFVSTLRRERQQYAPYNLIIGQLGNLKFYSNHNDEMVRLGPGIYGVSNGALDAGWPKVRGVKQDLSLLLKTADISVGALLAILADRALADDGELPQTGVGLQWERTLSARFIMSENYGTRASTVLLVHKDGRVEFAEKSFGFGGKETGYREYCFSLPG